MIMSMIYSDKRSPSGGGYHKPSALHSTDPIRVAKDSSECLFSESARTQPQKLMGQL